MKKLKSLLVILFSVLILQGCVISAKDGLLKTDNGFYLSVTDQNGNEIKTGASINDPEFIPELEKMYGHAVDAMDRMIKEQGE